MFHFDITMEDIRIVVGDGPPANHNSSLRGSVFDLYSGASLTVKITHNELASILALAIHNDGEPVNAEVTAKHYEVAEAWHRKYNMDVESLERPENASNRVFRIIP